MQTIKSCNYWALSVIFGFGFSSSTLSIQQRVCYQKGADPPQSELPLRLSAEPVQVNELQLLSQIGKSSPTAAPRPNDPTTRVPRVTLASEGISSR